MKTRKARGYWKCFEHVVDALMPFVREHGHLPSQIEMAELHLSSLWDAMRKYHGGYREVARCLMIQTAQEHAANLLKDWDAFSAEIMPMVRERGYFPTHVELINEKRGDIISALRIFHGGTVNAAQRLGIRTFNDYYELKSSGYWNREKTIDAYIDVIEKHGFTHWPSPSELKGLGYDALRAAVGPHAGSFRELREMCRERGIDLSPKPRKLEHLLPFETQYPIADYIFHDSELKFYFIGLIAADGHVIHTKSEWSVEICLNKYDIGLIEKLRDLISPSRPIHIKPHKSNPASDAVRLKLSSRKLVEMIAGYIEIEDKTHSLSWPGNIPDDYLRHFIRGYFDGDGTIDLTTNQQIVAGEKRYYHVMRLRFLGTRPFLEGLTQAIHRLTDIEPVKVSSKGLENVSVIYYTGKSAVKILAYLYDGATLYLDRKRAVYAKIRDTSKEKLGKIYNSPEGRLNHRAKHGKL